jgi:hypothetical protein
MNYPSRRVDPSLQLQKKEKVAQSYSSTALGLTTHRIVKSAWPPFAIRRKMSWTPQYDNEQLTDVSANEPTADAPQDDDEEHQRIRRAKNAKRAQRKHNA